MSTEETSEACKMVDNIPVDDRYKAIIRSMLANEYQRGFCNGQISGYREIADDMTKIIKETVSTMP